MLNEANMVFLDDQKTVEVEYECAQCGATDKGRFFVGDDDPIASAINCTCGAGRGLSQQESCKRGVGMFPVQPPAAVVH